MVDYTTKETRTGNVGLYLVAGGVGLVILFAIFGSSGPSAIDAVPLVDEVTAPVATD